MPNRYKSASECREKIVEYMDQLKSASDDENPELRDQVSTDRYLQDLRWFDEWLDEEGIDSPSNVSPAKANKLGRTLADRFHGTTSLYRWDRIFAFYDWLVRMGLTETNPLERWDEDKSEQFGLTKSTEQERHLEDDEMYAVSREEVRMMEENVSRHRVRDQLIIRLLWQTGIRRSEASGMELRDLDREAREITIREPVAKNGVERVVAYQPSLDGLLSQWLDGGHRTEMAAGADHDRLLVGERGGRLSGDRINEIIIDAANDAGINRRLYADANAAVDADGNKIKNRWLISAHNVRHGFGTYMVNETDAGLWEISKTMGHSSVKITEDVYVEDDPRAGVDHIHQYGPE